MIKKLIIIIPVYNQTHLLKRCLFYLENQTFKDFMVIIQDDASQENYKEIILEFPTLEIVYSRNTKNLGAMSNMINCLTQPVNTEFIMCLHEDDFIHYEYLDNTIKMLEEDENLALAGSHSYFFNPKDTIPPMVSTKPKWRKYDLLEFTEFILNYNKFAFGSIIYRQKFIKKNYIDVQKYEALMDRPFLLQILQNNNKKALIFDNHFYYYQNHPYPDKRWGNLSMENIINLYTYYERLAPKKGKYITSQYIYDFINFLENKKLSDFYKFIKIGKENNLISIKRINFKFILASILILIFGKRVYSKLFELIKNF